MIGRKAVIGLSLLCALLFSGIAVQSASAAEATNTTFVTCVKGGVTLDFTDAHCDHKVKSGTGTFSHANLTPKVGETTEIEISNEKVAKETTERDSHTLRGEPFGLKTEITCKTVEGTGTIGNTEPAGGVHKISGKGTINYKDCEVKLISKCTKVKEPIVVKAEASGNEAVLEGKVTHGIEFKAEAGKPFTEITLEGTCAIAGKAFPVEGGVVATGNATEGGVIGQSYKHHGSTLVFTHEMTKNTLTVGGKKGEYQGTLTAVMKGKGDPIAATTTT